MHRLICLPLAFLLLAACGPAHHLKSVVAPADAPLFAQLLGAPIPGVPGEAGWARLVGEANHALAVGDYGMARALLADAVAGLPEDPAPCSVRGALLYLQGVAAKFAGVDDDDSWATLSATCPGDMVTRLKDLWSWVESPGVISDEEVAGLRNAAAGHEPDRVVLFAAASDWIEVAAARNPDPCDRAFASRKRQELRALSEKLGTLGRPDLAMFGMVRALVVDREVVPEAVAELAAWVEAPANRWLRREAAGRALDNLSRRADWVDPLFTVPLCNPYFSDLLVEIEGDHDEGSNGRNARRLVSAWAAAAVCLDKAPARDLTDRVVSAAASGGADPVAVLEALGVLAGQITLTALEGRAGDLATLLGEVADSLRRLREGLGNAREERILHASLGVFVGAAELFRGRAGHALAEVSTAADLLDHLAESGPGDTSHNGDEELSEIERLAPALRGSSLVALAFLQWLTEQSVPAAATLQRLDATLEGDLSALFQVLDAPDHSVGIARIVRGVAKSIAKDWPGALAALDAATVPGSGSAPEESGWWAVGLDAGRMVAWDLLAILAWKEAREVGVAALVKGEGVSRRLVDDALEHFQVRGTGWELLSVIPLAHQAIPGFLLEETDWKSITKDLARAVEPALEQALARVEPRSDDAPPGFTDLLVDVLRDATEVGLDVLVDQGREALPRLADLLDARVDGYQGELRFLLGMFAGAARFFHQPAVASEGLLRVGEQTPEVFADIAWMPLLLDSVLKLKVADDPEAALASLDAVIAAGEREASCGLDAPVHALLPARMWLREVTGEVVGAVEDHRAFRRLSGRGFSGHASFACRLNSQRGGLTVNAQVGQSLSALFVPVGQEGSFNVGAGWTSVPQDADDVACWATSGQGPRDDVVLHAHLAAAFYAMRRGDDFYAHRALVDAVAAGRRLINGGSVILGDAATASIAAARDAVALDLLAWVSFTARIRGHISAADHLADQAVRLLSKQETDWEKTLPADHAPPVFLARLPELPDLGPHVRAWHLAKDHTEKASVMKAVAKDRALRKTSLIPAWGVRLVKELQEVSAANAAGKPMPALSKPPQSLHGRAVVDAWTWIVGLWGAPASFSLQDFNNHAGALGGAGLHRETVGIAATVVALVRGTQLDPMGGAVLAAAADRIPRDTFSVTRAAVLNEMAPILMRSGDLRLAMVGHRDMVHALRGRVAPRIELQNRLNLVNLLGALEMVPELTTEVRTLLPMVERRYGRVEGIFHSLLSVDVALRIFQVIDVPPDGAIDALVAGADDAKGAAPAKQYFRILAGTEDSEARRQLSVDYLRFMFLNGPPLQEPAPTLAPTPTSGSPRTPPE